MTDQHPITPSPELVQKWVAATESNDCIGALPTNFEQRICTAAARWGADQELEACCEWLIDQNTQSKKWFDPRHEACALAGDLRAARRPKPPSLKEQALQALANADGADHPVVATVLTADQHALIRKALEQLDD